MPLPVCSTTWTSLSSAEGRTGGVYCSPGPYEPFERPERNSHVVHISHFLIYEHYAIVRLRWESSLKCYSLPGRHLSLRFRIQTIVLVTTII